MNVIRKKNIRIACCYAHVDQRFVPKLKEHLALLWQENEITFWTDMDIPPGGNWEHEIETRLDEAQIILLFISASFLASDYCYGKEMKKAMMRQGRGEAYVIPIIVRSVEDGWKKAPFGRLQALPKDAKAITEWSNEDQALANVAEGVRQIVREVLRREQTVNRPTTEPFDPPSVGNRLVRGISRRRLLLMGLGVGTIGIGAGAIFTVRALSFNGPPGIWTPQNSGVSQEDLTRITWSGKLFVAVGNNGTILSSPDGRTWTIQHAKFPGPYPPLLTDVIWSGKLFVAVGPSTILTSPDGRTWTIQARYDPLQVGFALAVAGSRSQLVVVGDKGTILTSPDGHTWTLQNSGTLQRLNDIVWSGTQFVAVGDSGTVLSSPDGRTWTRRYSATASQMWSGVAWSGSRFVAVGINAILTSPDGIFWTSHGPSTLGKSAIFTNIAWAQSQFVAVGYGGFILSSPDGETWTAQASDSEVSLFGIAGSPSRFVAVGQAGMIVASP